MQEFDLLTHTKTVEAPPGFEQRVMAHLAERKHHQRKVRRFGFSLATAAASVLVVVLALNFLVLPQRSPDQMVALEKKISSDFHSPVRIPTIPITEALNFSGEIRQISQQPRSIYILEQVSDRTDAKLIY